MFAAIWVSLLTTSLLPLEVTRPRFWCTGHFLSFWVSVYLLITGGGYS